ncbi:kelch domain-containing protein 7A-like [Conger conger]|uniref:kelch domain-containing protein 7A-like n=1 Tax=Conger conger TaxID=82655 RepID=UPI002A59ED63|nr:kelch domain-containing protein 7A-like [Conger conger]
MATAEDLPGAGFDMQLMGKFALSLVAVLLISWAYKFSGSWGRGRRWRRRAPDQSNGSVGPPTDSQTPAGTCIKCKAELRPEKAQVPASAETGRAEDSPRDPENDRPERREYPAENSKTQISEKYSSEDYESEPGGRHKHSPENGTWDRRQPPLSPSEKEAVEHIKHRPENSRKGLSEQREYRPESPSAYSHAEVLQSEPQPNGEGRGAPRGLGCTLSPPPATEPGRASPTGRRSPCTLRKLEQSAGVRRELRQDLGHPGTFSSFRSKVEIRVEDANLLLERPGREQVEVRGKIYEFYAESSSQSSDYPSSPDVRSPTVRQYQDLTSQDLQPRGRAMGRERYAGGRTAKLPVTPGSHVSPLIMRDVGEGDSNPIGSTARSTVDRSPSPSLPNKPPIRFESPTRAHFSQPPLESARNPELDSLIGRLNLGNCLQALTLARKYRHASLEESALRVMSDNYLQVLQDPGLYGRLTAHDREEIRTQRMKGRKYLMAADINPEDWMRTRAMAGSSDSGVSSGLYCYDDYQDTWHHMSPLPTEVVSGGCAVCTMDNYLFVAVGCEGAGRYARPSGRVFCFNPATRGWTELRPMNQARRQCRLAALRGQVYAVGGEGLRTVERYDPQTARWSFAAPLPVDGAHRATSCAGELFVLGGGPRHALLRYDPRADAWRQSPVAGGPGSTVELAAVRSSLYRFDVLPSRGLAVYRYHVTARLWYECCRRRPAPRPAFRCVAVDDVIYCLGRGFAARLLAHEVSPAFDEADPRSLAAAGGDLFPFTLAFPDKSALQTGV